MCVWEIFLISEGGVFGEDVFCNIEVRYWIGIWYWYGCEGIWGVYWYG